MGASLSSFSLCPSSSGGVSLAPELLKPQNVQLPKDQLRRLRKSILSGQLAPCFAPSEGDDCKQLWEDPLELEECPICCHDLPGLNTTLCCRQRVCTNCVCQLQALAAGPPQGGGGGGAGGRPSCPFCKAPAYRVQVSVCCVW